MTLIGQLRLVFGFIVPQYPWTLRETRGLRATTCCDVKIRDWEVPRAADGTGLKGIRERYVTSYIRIVET